MNPIPDCPMKEIKAYLRANMADAVIDALESHPELPGLTVIEVKGYGHPRNRDAAEMKGFVKLEIVVLDEQTEAVVQTILQHGRTGRVGDGMIFVSSVAEAIRIRNGQRGHEAIHSSEPPSS